ncbi:MAG: SHOCT domain-containing protein [Chloroflexota bacterium]
MRARRVIRRAARRTARRIVRRRWRRRIVVGGMVLLAAGGAAAAIKLTQKDARRIEEHTGASVEELTEEELVAAMRDLGIKSIALDENDRAIITGQKGQSPPAQPQASYLDELERLAGLRDRGVISDDDFEARKKQLLGL